MSFKLLEIGMDALRRVRIGGAALVAAAVCVATYPPNGVSRASGR